MLHNYLCRGIKLYEHNQIDEGVIKSRYGSIVYGFGKHHEKVNTLN